MTDKYEEMLQAAHDYCSLIEQLDDGRQDILERLVELLPRLHASISVFQHDDGKNGHFLDVDLDARFELFSRLRQLIGERDSYWLEYDAVSDELCKTGSLADDLTDIYCELKNGLLSLEEKRKDTDEAILGWRNGYEVHWGRHLVDAEKHLYDLQTKNQI